MNQFRNKKQNYQLPAMLSEISKISRASESFLNFERLDRNDRNRNELKPERTEAAGLPFS